MLISIKKFIRPLIFLTAIIFVTINVTGCASTFNTIKTISQAEKAKKVFKGAQAVIDVVDVKRNVGDLADKILKHK